MLDRVRIWTLREAGHTLEQIAVEVGVGKRSVRRVLKEERITSPESAPTPRSRGIGRPSRVEAFGGDVRPILQDEPSLPTVEVLSRLRGLGYTGGKSAVYELARSLRPKPVRAPEVRFEGMPGEFSFGVELCWPRRANQKGSVENLVGWVKGSFFKVRRFHDRQDIEQQLVAWLEEVNLRRPSRATGQTPAERIEAERKRLSLLPIPPAEYPLRIVTRDGTEVEHPRRPAVGNTSYRSEDRVAKLAAVHGQRGRLYQKRQEILELGPPALSGEGQ